MTLYIDQHVRISTVPNHCAPIRVTFGGQSGDGDHTITLALSMAEACRLKEGIRLAISRLEFVEGRKQAVPLTDEQGGWEWGANGDGSRDCESREGGCRCVPSLTATVPAACCTALDAQPFVTLGGAK